MPDPFAVTLGGENRRSDTHEAALEASATGKMAMAAPRQQSQLGQPSGHPSRHGPLSACSVSPASSLLS